MKIDFNNARRKLGISYNNLIRFLMSRNTDGTICFDDDEFEGIANDLRGAIGSIMCTYELGDDGFKNMYNDPLLLIYDTFMNRYNDESDTNAE